MEFLTIEECRAWARRHGHYVAGPGAPSAPSPAEPTWDFRLPQRSSVQVAFARALWAGVTGGAPAEVLVWVTDWGMSGESAHLPLMEATRRGLGATRPLIQSPGHLAPADEPDAGLSILMLVLLFGWDASLLPAGDYPAVYVGNDEYGSFTGRGDATVLRQWMADFEVTVTEGRRAAL